MDPSIYKTQTLSIYDILFAVNTPSIFSKLEYALTAVALCYTLLYYFSENINATAFLKGYPILCSHTCTIFGSGENMFKAQHI